MLFSSVFTLPFLPLTGPTYCPQSSHEPLGLEIPRLPQSEDLLKGLNFASYTKYDLFTYRFPNGTEVQEHIGPYWFRLGFDIDVLRADLDAMAIMGVKHVRSFTLIFQFIEWDDSLGYLGLNDTAVANFGVYLEELAARGMTLTPTLFARIGTPDEHPSLRHYFEVFQLPFDPEHIVEPHPLVSLADGVIDFISVFEGNPVIHTWEIVNEFSAFMCYLINPPSKGGLSLSCNATQVWHFMCYVRNRIKAADPERYVTISDEWFEIYSNTTWWYWNIMPKYYNESLPTNTDYHAVHHYEPTSQLHALDNVSIPAVIGEIGSPQMYNYSRAVNCRFLLEAYRQAHQLGYSGFMPWQFCENIVYHERTGPGGHALHDWCWDALLLFSLYRDDSVDFLDTTNWYILSTEPQLDAFGHINLTFFHRAPFNCGPPCGFGDGRYFDPSQIGVSIRILSRHLMTGTALVQNVDSTILLPLIDELFGKPDNNVLVMVNGTGQVRETGITVQSNGTWTASVISYIESSTEFDIESSDPFTIIVEDGEFRVRSSLTYKISVQNLLTGESISQSVVARNGIPLTWQSTAGHYLISIVVSAETNLGIPIVLALVGCIAALTVGSTFVIRRRKLKDVPAAVG
ncbi:MAG: hypothetical protein QXS20_10370 [Candidatus Thorarchaeota archaeon]